MNSAGSCTGTAGQLSLALIKFCGRSFVTGKFPAVALFGGGPLIRGHSCPSFLPARCGSRPDGDSFGIYRWPVIRPVVMAVLVAAPAEEWRLRGGRPVSMLRLPDADETRVAPKQA
jgi:hypothetical protein